MFSLALQVDAQQKLAAIYDKITVLKATVISDMEKREAELNRKKASELMSSQNEKREALLEEIGKDITSSSISSYEKATLHCYIAKCYQELHTSYIFSTYTEIATALSHAEKAMTILSAHNENPKWLNLLEQATELTHWFRENCYRTSKIFFQGHTITCSTCPTGEIRVYNLQNELIHTFSQNGEGFRKMSPYIENKVLMIVETEWSEKNRIRILDIQTGQLSEGWELGKGYCDILGMPNGKIAVLSSQTNYEKHSSSEDLITIYTKTSKLISFGHDHLDYDFKKMSVLPDGNILVKLNSLADFSSPALSSFVIFDPNTGSLIQQGKGGNKGSQRYYPSLFDREKTNLDLPEVSTGLTHSL